MGPFDIEPRQIARLGTRFAAFVNRLLDVERSAEGLMGRSLGTTANEYLGDGGVDATTKDTPGGDWIPRGDTAWQFKSADRAPATCAKEIGKATWAKDYLRNGGHYVLVLGAELPDNLKASRQNAVANRAEADGVITTAERSRILVYDANSLASWASRYPALAVSRLIGGPGPSAYDFESWTGLRIRTGAWVSDPSRDDAISTIRARLADPETFDIRVQGEPGAGKSRLVLEALDDDLLRPLVAYIKDERELTAEFMNYVCTGGRRAILVVDDCPPEQHRKLADILPRDGEVKLLTIGGDGPVVSKSPILTVGPLALDRRDAYLRETYPQLRPEARLFVSNFGEGNLQMSSLLAQELSRVGEAHAAELISHGSIRGVVAALVPGGTDFLTSAVLSLFERVGFDRDRRYQLELLAEFLGRPTDSVASAAVELEHRGVLVRQGRYRAISPRPLAVFLAADAWSKLDSRRLVEELLPRLDDEMALAFFRRVADLGRFGPATSALEAVLGKSGPFASLEAIEAAGSGRLLTQLAIVLPEEVAGLISKLVAEAPPGALAANAESRRDLVWTLEKLAWHRETFESAADSLLHLACEENESYRNNATGTWIDLFGARLPGTSALPGQRIEYLQGVADSPVINHRALTERAASHGLATHESISVSGEIQGGAVVAPRGAPGTWAEYWEYRATMFGLLTRLRNDPDDQVSTAADESLFSLLHGILGDPHLAPSAIAFYGTLQGQDLHRLRCEIEHLDALYARIADRSSDTGETPRPDDELIRKHLVDLRQAVGDPTGLEAVALAVDLKRWDFRGESYQNRVIETLRSLPKADRDKSLSFADRAPQGAWELGYAFAIVEGARLDRVEKFVRLSDSDSRGLVGYLWGLHDSGEAASFDDFLKGRGTTLSPAVRLDVAVRGPVSRVTRAAVRKGLRSLPVATGVYAVFGWQDNMTPRDIAVLVPQWQGRMETQRDYTAVISFLSGWIRGRTRVPPSLQQHLKEVVHLRERFPDLGTDEWEWCDLAGRLLPESASEITELLMNLIERCNLMIHPGDPPTEVLVACVQADPHGAWVPIAAQLLAGSWRVRMEIRGWLLPMLPPSLITSWIGTDAVRARAVAEITPVSGNEPSDVVKYLLQGFPSDEQIASGLWSTFTTGSWTGPESDRLLGQIRMIEKWRTWPTPRPVREWANQANATLQEWLQAASERESERGF